MQKLTKLKSKIKGIQNIKKITNAMEIISATKLMRIEKVVKSVKTYQENTQNIINNIASGYELQTNPYVFKNTNLSNIIILCISSEKGLCGGFNNNLYQYLENYISTLEIKNFNLIIAGKKGSRFFKNKKFPIDISFEKLDDKHLDSLGEKIANKLLETFHKNYSKIVIIYNRFRGGRLGKLACLNLLPISNSEITQHKLKSSYIYEPTADEVINNLVPYYIWVSVYSCLVESRASEEVTRMLAMKQATDNANDMIGELKLKYNRLRQTDITRELADIIGGYEAK